ncbi:MAG: hypothetical protein KF749_13315 [Bacteroidetes bacterium]|nr:hypothetical protein [Bacteroidota bacterium]MCW5894327.1 hypothetical protein [Bacteroidota bacterium]
MGTQQLSPSPFKSSSSSGEIMNTMTKINSLFIFFSIWAFGSDCLAQFAVSRDVPENPSVVVVPNGYSSDEVELADKVEEMLMSFKIRIVQRPSLRRVTETKGAAKTAGGDEGSAVGSKGMTEEYFAYEETGADYLLLTDENTDRAKLVKIKTREIVASSKALAKSFNPCQDAFRKQGEDLGFSSAAEYCLFLMLQSAGLPVKLKGTSTK